MSPPKKKAAPLPATVHVEILACFEHGYYAVAIDDHRITPSKCCGSWKPVREFDIAVSEIAAQLPAVRELHAQAAEVASWPEVAEDPDADALRAAVAALGPVKS